MNADEECPGEGKCHGCMCWCDRCGDVTTVCDCEVCDRHRCARCNMLLTRLDHDRYDGELYMFCMGCVETAEFEALERELIKQIANGWTTHGNAVSFKQHCEGIWPTPYYGEWVERFGRVVPK
jgi:hypothetical protein